MPGTERSAGSVTRTRLVVTSIATPYETAGFAAGATLSA